MCKDIKMGKDQDYKDQDKTHKDKDKDFTYNGLQGLAAKPTVAMKQRQ